MIGISDNSISRIISLFPSFRTSWNFQHVEFLFGCHDITKHFSCLNDLKIGYTCNGGKGMVDLRRINFIKNLNNSFNNPNKDEAKQKLIKSSLELSICFSELRGQETVNNMCISDRFKLKNELTQLTKNLDVEVNKSKISKISMFSMFFMPEVIKELSQSIIDKALEIALEAKNPAAIKNMIIAGATQGESQKVKNALLKIGIASNDTMTIYYAISEGEDIALVTNKDQITDLLQYSISQGNEDLTMSLIDKGGELNDDFLNRQLDRIPVFSNLDKIKLLEKLLLKKNDKTLLVKFYNQILKNHNDAIKNEYHLMTDFPLGELTERGMLINEELIRSGGFSFNRIALHKYYQNYYRGCKNSKLKNIYSVVNQSITDPFSITDSKMPDSKMPYSKIISKKISSEREDKHVVTYHVQESKGSYKVTVLDRGHGRKFFPGDTNKKPLGFQLKLNQTQFKEFKKEAASPNSLNNLYEILLNVSKKRSEDHWASNLKPTWLPKVSTQKTGNCYTMGFDALVYHQCWEQSDKDEAKAKELYLIARQDELKYQKGKIEELLKINNKKSSISADQSVEKERWNIYISRNAYNRTK